MENDLIDVEYVIAITGLSLQCLKKRAYSNLLPKPVNKPINKPMIWRKLLWKRQDILAWHNQDKPSVFFAGSEQKKSISLVIANTVESFFHNDCQQKKSTA